MARQISRKYLLGEWELATEKRLLFRNGTSIRLANKPFRVLLYLIDNRERLVSRAELLEHFWEGSDVYDATLTQCVGAIRRALNDRLDQPRFIETRWAGGYRYIGPFDEQIVDDPTTVFELQESRAVRVVVEEEEILEAAPAPVQKESLWNLTSPRLSLRSSALLTTCAVAVVVAAVLLVYRGQRHPSLSQSTSLHSVAVLPLKNVSDDPSSEYFSDGITENLINTLSRIDGLRVISRGSVFTLKGKNVDPQEVGKMLHVDALLEGSVLKSGERVRVDVRLVSTSDGRVLWASNPSERAIGDIFTIQDEIARNAAAGLQIQLSGEDKKRLAQRNTDNLEAYQAYLKGLYFANKRTPEGFEKSFAYFQQAIEKDRRYALAYAGLARTRALSVWFIQAPPDEAMAQTKAAAERALEIDDTLAEAHIAMSQVYWHWWDFANGLREDQRAIELDSGSAEAHHGYAYSLMLLGKPQEAITEMKRALDLDPLSVVMNVDVGEILLYARHYDEAIEALSKALEMDPHRPNVHHDLAEAYEQMGRHREAIAEYIQEDAVVGEQPKTLANFQEAFAVSGMRGFWQRKLESFKEREQRGYFPPFVIAEVYARLDDKDQAFAWLEKAYAERSPMLLNLRNSAPFDGLHSDPRFASLARRVGLSD